MARSIPDLAGQQFGRLTMPRRAPNARDDKALWVCECNCSNQKKTAIVVSACLRTHALMRVLQQESTYRAHSRFTGQAAFPPLALGQDHTPSPSSRAATVGVRTPALGV
jgi:hypothetical protein